MKSFLILFLSSILLTTANSQSKNNLWVELNGDLTNTSLTNAAVNPAIVYFPVNAVGVRASGYLQEFGGETEQALDLSVRYYPGSSCFAQAGVITDLDESTGLALSVGYTASLGGKFYIEPSVRYVSVDKYNQLGISLGVGIKLN